MLAEYSRKKSTALPPGDALVTSPGEFDPGEFPAVEFDPVVTGFETVKARGAKATLPAALPAALAAAEAKALKPAARVHFQLFSMSTPARVRWRLLSGNRREIGRSAASYATADECRAALHALLANLDALTPRIARMSSSGWSWELQANGVAQVISGRRFDRQIRCAQALELFRELAPTAVVHAAVMSSQARRGAGDRVRLETLSSRALRTGPVSRPAPSLDPMPEIVTETDV